MTTEEMEYGSFNVTGNEIRVTDPCYEYDSDGGVTLRNVKQGKWYAKAYFVDKYDGWGVRVSALRIAHEQTSINNEPGLEFDDRRCIAVDSGQAGFYDMVRYPKEEGKDKDKFYVKNCDLTLTEEQGGIVNDMGAVASSGYGDGCYYLYYDVNDDEQIVSAEIIFIDMEEDEDA